MSERSGRQYRSDRAFQRFEPMRRVDAFVLAHPLANVASFVVLTVGFALLVGFAFHSAVLGIVVGLAAGVFAGVTTRRNHRRRVANGTSAQFGPPRSS